MSALQSMAQLTSSQIVNCFVLGIAIAVLAGSASALAGRKRSGIRFSIWFAALIAIASLFFLSKPIARGAAAAHVGAPEILLPPEWALYIFGVWTLFTTFGLGRVARGLWRVRMLKQCCVPLESSLAASLAEAVTPISRQMRLCTSERVRVPAALGFFRPVIVLPVWSVHELSPEELNTVVLHEAAHLQRWDDWTNLFQKIVRALLFFHPAVWWIDSRLSMEREMSCDDAVLARSRSARQYAACLVSLAEKTHAHRSLALAQAAVSHLKHTAKRISKILDGNERTSKPLLRPAVAAVAAFGAISFVVVQHAPQFVSFRDAARRSAQVAPGDKFDYVAIVNPPSGKAVAASLRLPSPATAMKAGVPQRHKVATPHAQHTMNRAPLPTEEAQSRFEKRNPAVVNAAMSDDAAPRFVYLVTQTERYDGFGNVTVITSVWRIRVVKPAPAQAQNTAAPHQT